MKKLSNNECPKCKKQNPAGILYGMPGPIGKEDDEKENIVYGGCGDYGYDYECRKCFYQWAEDKPQSGEYNEWDSMTEEGEYKNGKPHGIWTTRTRLGVKWFERTFNMGEIEGKVLKGFYMLNNVYYGVGGQQKFRPQCWGDFKLTRMSATEEARQAKLKKEREAEERRIAQERAAEKRRKEL